MFDEDKVHKLVAQVGLDFRVMNLNGEPVFDEDNAHKLVAQVGLDFRVMNLNGEPVKVLGIIDLCVMEGYRSREIASMLLSEIDNFSQRGDL